MYQGECGGARQSAQGRAFFHNPFFNLAKNTVPEMRGKFGNTYGVLKKFVWHS
jgi:hypothetical protein